MKKKFLVTFNNKKFGDYVKKEFYPSQLPAEKANRSDDLENYLDMTFLAESNNTQSAMTNVIILISILSIPIPLEHCSI